MQTIWVVENISAPRSIAMDLMGDFAVRRIASLSTLLRIKSLDKANLPDIIIITDTGEDKSLVLRTRDLYSRSEIFITPEIGAGSAFVPSFKQIYLPFCPIEFIRMTRLALISEGRNRNRLTHGDLELDVVAQKITVLSSKETISLTRKETHVLKTFFEKPGACIDREELLQQVWDGVRVADRSIDSQICRLRKLIANYGLTISSIYGQGYVLA